MSIYARPSALDVALPRGEWRRLPERLWSCVELERSLPVCDVSELGVEEGEILVPSFNK
jgi:hypothetical protein